MATDCLFCRIVQGRVPSQKVFENDEVLGFQDVSPSAKIHNLFIHKQHTRDAFEMPPSQIQALWRAMGAWSQGKSVRVITNIGPQAGQSVFHTHFHVLGGEEFKGLVGR